MGHEEFSASLTNRSLRTVRTVSRLRHFTSTVRLIVNLQELEFLADNGIITRVQLTKMLDQLPAETSLTGGPVSAIVPPTNALSNLRLNSTTNGAREEKHNNGYTEPASTYNPPPAYGTPVPPPPPPAAPAPQVLTHAVSLYAYNGTDAGDLNLQPEDRIAVTEYMNAEWWKGRNERSGQEGIFPRSYVRIEEKALAATGPQASNYGNAPLDVASGAQPADPKKKGTAQKIGGKLGNAAIFGAGGKYSVQLSLCLETGLLTIISSYHWKQYCQFYLLNFVLILEHGV